MSGGCLTDKETGDVYWNCPIKFVPDSVWQFLSLHAYHKDFPSAPMPAYREVSSRFFQAYTFYNSKYNQFREELMKKG